MLADHSDLGHDIDVTSHGVLLPHISLDDTLGIRAISWLDGETDRYVRHVLTLLIARRQDLLAAVLFGSVARMEARLLTDTHPSDVDVLLIFHAEPGWTTISGSQHHAVSVAKVQVIDVYPDARELQFALTLPTFVGWDSSFIENIAHDGMLLWAHEPLPSALYAVQERADQETLVR